MAVVMVIVKGMMVVNGNSGSHNADGDIDGFSNGDGMVVLMMVMVVLEMMLIVVATIIVNGWC